MHVECWRDGNGLCVAPPDTVRMHRERGLMEKDAEFQYAIYADTWTECMTLHHQLQGWEPYVPFQEDDDGEAESASLRPDASR